MSSDAVIEVSNLSKCYYIYAQPEDRLKQMIFPKVQGLFNSTPKQYFTEYWASRHISFSVGRGETVGIVGSNGSGKSTLLQMICGTLEPTEGTIKTNGRIAALLELGAGFSPDFTGRQNAVLNAQILGLTDDEIAGRIADIEAFADVGEFFDRPVKTYSSGMYVRVAFAVQAMVEPEILVVDEALAVGDAPFQAKCMARINKLKERGTSILFVSHDAGAVKQLCDRAVWLTNGSVCMEGAPVDVISAYVRSISQESDVEAELDMALPDEAPIEAVESSADITNLDLENEVAEIASDNEIAQRIPPVDIVEAVCVESVFQTDPPIEEKPPVSHWGSNVGCLRWCQLLDDAGERINHVVDQMPLTVRMAFTVPLEANLETFGVAFAFRTLRGEDAVVSNTFDRKNIQFCEVGKNHVVEFKFNNMLNSGAYMLVGVVEDRQPEKNSYYEFHEGCQYFEVFQSEIYFGQCIVPIEQLLLVDGVGKGV